MAPSFTYSIRGSNQGAGPPYEKKKETKKQKQQKTSTPFITTAGYNIG